MLVFSDAESAVEPREALLVLRERMGALARVAEAALPRMERHGRLVSLFVDVSEIGQGLVDSDFSRTGRDRRSSISRALAVLAIALARLVPSSWLGAC